MSYARLSACMLIPHKGHTDTIQVYSVTVMTHVKALQAGHSSQGTSEPITPGSAMFTSGCTVLTPGCTVSLSLPLYRFSAGVYRVGCELRHGLGRNNHLLARHIFFFSSFSLDFRRC